MTHWQLYSNLHAEQTPLRIKPVGEVFVTDPVVHDTASLTESALVVSTEWPVLGASPGGVI